MMGDWALSIGMLIFKGNGNVTNGSSYRTVKIFVYGMNVVQEVLERKLSKMVTSNEMHFGLMHEKGSIY